MSESHEPSYYEIALTNRQVTVAFVVLLVCLVGAFFSGVWVGRSGEGGAAKTAAPQQAASGAAPLEEFHFFSDSAKGEKSVPSPAASPTVPEAVAVAPSPSPSPTLTPEVFPPSASPTAGAIASPAASAAASAAASPSAPSPITTPAPSPSVSASPAPTARSSPAATAADSAAHELAPGEVAVQVFSSPDGDQAKRVLARLKSGGFKVFLSPTEKSGKTVYRVRIGPFTDRVAAQRVADQVRKKYRYDTWITR